MSFKPMLAATEMPNPIKFPVFASYKIDGVRAMVRDGRLVSRSLKLIQNRYIQQLLGTPILEGLDGELAVGSPSHPNLMQMTTSGVMSHDGQPSFQYLVFDICNTPSVPYATRLLNLKEAFANYAWTSQFTPDVKLWEHKLIHNQAELDVYEVDALALGYEGVICRDPNSLYKYGRSTTKQGGMFKVKRFTDSEARITGFEEFRHNANEAFTDELGHTKRSSHQDNKIGMNKLGAFHAVDVHTGQAVKIGTGFTDQQRCDLWVDCVPKLTGKIVKYKYFNHGIKDAPRHPVFLGFRDPRDMS